MKIRRPILVAAIALAVTGCTGAKVTEIVVSIATDLTIPDQLAAFSFQVYNQASPANDAGSGLPVVDATFDVDIVPDPEGKTFTLPGTIGLLPAGDPARPIHISITGRSFEKKEIIWREGRLPFAKDRILLVRMNLLRSCLYIRCPAGQTCKGPNRTCESVDEPAEEYNPTFPRFLWDGKTQAPDLGSDGPRDARPPDKPIAVEGKTGDSRPTDLATPDVAKDFKPPGDAKPDAPKTDAAKLDAPKPDAAKTDGTVPDVAKPDAKKDSTVGDAFVPSCVDGWCKIPPGTFTMGSPSNEPCLGSNDDEKPHPVQVTRLFQVMEHEVTVDEWKASGRTDPSVNTTCGGTCPVENVSWNQAAAYCNDLSKAAKLTPCYSCTGTDPSVVCDLATAYSTSPYLCPGYRLPTEAEWEYAARAGSSKSLHNGYDLDPANCGSVDPNASAIAWYDLNSGLVKHPVMTRAKNAWGVYDMAGNVQEWVADGYLKLYDTLPGTNPFQAPFVPTLSCNPAKSVQTRGGRFNRSVDYTRSANRAGWCSNLKDLSTGFRCVRSLTLTSP